MNIKKKVCCIIARMTMHTDVNNVIIYRRDWWRRKNKIQWFVIIWIVLHF